MQGVLGLVGLVLVKARYPSRVELRQALKRMLIGHEYERLDPDQFAAAVLKQNKEVFDRLAEM